MGLVAWMLLRTILFSIIGNTVYKWFARTKTGVWFDKKVHNLLTKVTGRVEHLEIMDDNENGRSPPRSGDKSDKQP
jgi:hypothetical protein